MDLAAEEDNTPVSNVPSANPNLSGQFTCGPSLDANAKVKPTQNEFTEAFAQPFSEPFKSFQIGASGTNSKSTFHSGQKKKTPKSKLKSASIPVFSAPLDDNSVKNQTSSHQSVFGSDIDSNVSDPHIQPPFIHLDSKEGHSDDSPQFQFSDKHPKDTSAEPIHRMTELAHALKRQGNEWYSSMQYER
jgi:hypothetical protein